MPVTPQLYTARLPGGAAAVMDTRTRRGQWRHFNATAAHLWHQLTSGTPLDQVLDDLIDHFARQGADRHTARADLTALTGQLGELGLLDAPAAPAPHPAGEQPIRPPLPETTALTAADRAAGVLGLAAALLLLRCAPIRTSITAAHALTRARRRPAAAHEADLLLLAVRRAGLSWPGRSACLEESLGCFFAAWLRGRRVTWVIGARTAPAAAHAWIQAGEEVIGQDPSDRVWPYTPALLI
ncbi:lasso peptide biosynthesis B2 protein [Streptomyces sp. ME19-01-6]|uniref:lasso peptide biosynthesis B2 protein n=1 Tax=Streptomyces sp. ME19-01-6 TaxID=3028686 RepID=UPI0029ADFF4D|nr:lasso peptide biosynthesis B2 protein [Streptomyces sp. ME19-01-6]MDX3232548.1 lasso peptide biosynthesis B2 protein [Streptomyces sp. ME19-01-6]